MSGFPSTTTYASLTDEILGGLQGFTASPDAMTVLTSPCADTDTSFVVDDLTVLGRGVCEIGEELVYLKGQDVAGNRALTNLAWRGFQGTTVESHPTGTVVRMQPAFPRSTVKREINNVLLSIYPQVFGVRTLDLAVQQNSPHYALPAEARHVLDVRVKRTDTEPLALLTYSQSVTGADGEA